MSQVSHPAAAPRPKPGLRAVTNMTTTTSMAKFWPPGRAAPSLWEVIPMTCVTFQQGETMTSPSNSPRSSFTRRAALAAGAAGVVLAMSACAGGANGARGGPERLGSRSHQEAQHHRSGQPGRRLGPDRPCDAAGPAVQQTRHLRPGQQHRRRRRHERPGQARHREGRQHPHGDGLRHGGRRGNQRRQDPAGRHHPHCAPDRGAAGPGGPGVVQIPVRQGPRG